jgi:hypothetical protein
MASRGRIASFVAVRNVARESRSDGPKSTNKSSQIWTAKMAVAPLAQPATMQDIYDLEQRMLLSIGGLATKTDLDELKSSMKGLATKDDFEKLTKSLESKDAPFAGNACAT